jgi:tetratricopeptide (TPR) repeat protein
MNLDTLLTRLEFAQILRRVEDHDLTYSFHHTLTQEVAYESLLKQDRKRLHLLVGEVLERMYPDVADSRELAPMLAQHFDEAEDARALKYFAIAGDSAARVYANAEAVMHYTRALQISAPLSLTGLGVEMTDLYLKCGRVLELCGRYDDAAQNYVEMETRARERGDRAMQLAALMARATIHSTLTAKFDPQQGELLSDQALALATELDDKTAAAKILWNLMLLEMSVGHQQESVMFGERSLAIARELDLREQLAYTLNDISRAYAMSGQTDRALAALAEAREFWNATDNLPMLTDNLSSMALIYFMLGDYEKNIAFAQQARQMSREIGNLWGESYALETLGYTYLELGDLARAIEMLEEAARLGDQVGFLDAMLGARAYLALVYANLGARDRALELLDTVLRRVQQLGIDANSLLPQTVLAYWHIERNDLAAADALIEQVSRNLKPEEMTSSLPLFILLAEGELAMKKQEYDRAVATMDKFISWMDKIGFSLLLPDTLHLKSRALIEQGRLDEAHATLKQARSAATNSRRMLWQILGAMSRIQAERGNPAEARALRAQAREILEFIADHTPPDLRASFLNQPDARAVLDTK